MHVIYFQFHPRCQLHDCFAYSTKKWTVLLSKLASLCLFCMHSIVKPLYSIWNFVFELHTIWWFCLELDQCICTPIYIGRYDDVDNVLLRSEIPSGMCAKLRTVAASNNRDHAHNLSSYCLLVLHIKWCYSSRTSHSCWITQSTQHHRRGCNSIILAKFRQCISAIFVHKSVAQLLYMQHSETQVATSSLTLID